MCRAKRYIKMDIPFEQGKTLKDFLGVTSDGKLQIQKRKKKKPIYSEETKIKYLERSKKALEAKRKKREEFIKYCNENGLEIPKKSYRKKINIKDTDLREKIFIPNKGEFDIFLVRG